MRLDDDFDEDTPSSAIAWTGGAAVTAGILLALAVAQSAI
jgi:hypothetical protein